MTGITGLLISLKFNDLSCINVFLQNRKGSSGGGVDPDDRSLSTSAIYPVAGALLGTCLGGPVGLLAGVKIGGLAAIGGSVFGEGQTYTEKI